MEERNRKILKDIISRIGNPHKKRIKPLPPHERKEIYIQNILVFVLKHKLFDGNGFAEFERKFRAGEIPKESIEIIKIAMRRAKNDRLQSMDERKSRLESKKRTS